MPAEHEASFDVNSVCSTFGLVDFRASLEAIGHGESVVKSLKLNELLALSP